MTDEPRLTHVDEAGAARMVDVSGKDLTTRVATASGRVLTTAEVLGLLRGERPDQISSEIAEAFGRLHDHVVAGGIRIGGIDSPFMLDGEGRLLGWLASFQRRRLDLRPGDDLNRIPGLLESLRRCAELLERAGMRIDYRNAQRLKLRSWEATGKPSPIVTPLQQTLLEFLAERRVASTRELTALGASRHTVSVMWRKGLLRRLAHGVYAALPDTAAAPRAA